MTLQSEQQQLVAAAGITHVAGDGDACLSETDSHVEQCALYK